VKEVKEVNENKTELEFETLEEIPPVKRVGNSKIHKKIVEEAIKRGVTKVTGKAGCSQSIKRLIRDSYPAYDGTVTTRGKDLVVKMVRKGETGKKGPGGK
jgi:hypothetical protein